MSIPIPDVSGFARALRRFVDELPASLKTADPAGLGGETRLGPDREKVNMALVDTGPETVVEGVPAPSPDLFPNVPDFPLPDETLSVVEITPAVARSWLKRNTHNRVLKKRTLATYTRMMREGLWTFNGDSIRFDRDGVLLDGQTRLQAVIDSGRAQRFVVVTGLEPESQMTMDAGALRSASDNFHIDGYKNRHILSATIIIALRMERNDLGVRNVRFGTPEVQAWLTAHPEVIEYVNTAAATWRHYDITAAPLAYVMWRLAQVDQDEATRFFEDWRTSKTTGEGDPLATLIARFRRARNSGVASEKIDQYLAVAFTLIAWNARMRGQRMSRLSRGSQWGRIRIPEPVGPGAAPDVEDHIPHRPSADET